MCVSVCVLGGRSGFVAKLCQYIGSSERSHWWTEQDTLVHFYYGNFHRSLYSHAENFMF